MPSDLQRLGKIAEDAARDYLENLGYEFVEAQWHHQFGEIDLIMWDENEMVFVEVKWRKNDSFSHPEDMVDTQKMQKLQKTAQEYIDEHHASEDFFWRFDIVALSGDTHNYKVFHIKDALRND